MRHRKDIKRLGMQSAHRKATLRNQVKSFFEKESITTTLALAKQSRRLAERLITIGKRDTVAARRQAFAILSDRTLVKLLFSDIAPRFASRNGGYTRLIHAGERHGDNASLAILQLTEMKEKEKNQKKSTKKAAAKEEKKASAAKGEQKAKKAKEPAAPVDEKEQPKDAGIKEDRKGFLGGLRKFLKQDNPE